MTVTVTESSLNANGFFPNVGHACSSLTPQLSYETWYSIIMGVTMACDDTGAYELWLDGSKIAEYHNIVTTADCSSTIDNILIGGTIAQPAYDAPPHQRKFDVLVLADSWQDIVASGHARIAISKEQPARQGRQGRP